MSANPVSLISSHEHDDSLRVPVDHALVGKSEHIPITASTPVISISPVTLKIPDRVFDLQMRISAPVVGEALPIILISHGHGPSNNLSSLNGYGPMANFFAARGFVVIQPTHLSSRSLSLPPETPEAPLFWRSRVQDMKAILDHLADIENTVSFIKGRLDHERIAVMGHSMGGHTASMLLGSRLVDPNDGSIVDMIEPRIKAGILLTPPGNGGADLSTYALEHYSFFREPTFRDMRTPALIVVGDSDHLPHLTIRGSDWNADMYHMSTGPKSLLTISGGKHGLGGVSGYDAAECQDESPERLAAVQRLAWAYLRSTLYPGDQAWEKALTAFAGIEGIGRVESK